MKLRLILEEFKGYANKDEKKVVFKNPSFKEMIELGKEIRYVAFLESKDVYVSSAYATTHGDIQDVFDDKKRKDMFDYSKAINGLAIKQGKLWITKRISEMPKEYYKKNDIKEKYSWLSKYRIELLNAEEMNW